MLCKIPAWKKMANYWLCQKVWEATPKGCSLRTVLLEWKCACQTTSSFVVNVGKLPKEFLEEMAVHLMKRAENRGKHENPAEFATRIKAQLRSEHS
jgi:hypothetical protein